MRTFELSKTRSFALLSRRSVLRGVALATFATPVIRKMEAFAATAAPRRVILIFSPNGPMMANGPVSGSETGFTFHDWWRPLERHRADGIFMSHMAPAGLGVAPGREHGFGTQTFSGYGADTYDCRGETIDEVIARRLEMAGRAGAVRSVFWAIEGGGQHNAFTTGPNASKPAQINPQLGWGALFQDFTGPAPTDAAAHQQALLKVARKRSVLDLVTKDCVALKNALGSEGMRMLDEHCTTIRTMEAALMNPPPPPASSCVRPDQPAAQNWSSPETIDAHTSAFIDLMAMALACERTHVIAFQFGGQGARNRLASSYGVPSAGVQDSMDSGPAHHPWTHEPTDMNRKRDALKKFTTFYSTQVAALIDKLKATHDASGKNLLDSTVVVWLPEFGGSPQNDTTVQGYSHGHMVTQIPVVMFGAGQGTFRTGRYHRGQSTGISDGSANSGDTEAGRDMARTLVSVVQYMGFTDVQTVGATGVNGPFAWLY